MVVGCDARKRSARTLIVSTTIIEHRGPNLARSSSTRWAASGSPSPRSLSGTRGRGRGCRRTFSLTAWRINSACEIPVSQAMRRSEALSSAGRHTVVFCMPSTLCQGSRPTPTVPIRTGDLPRHAAGLKVQTRWTGHTSSWPVPQTKTSMSKLRNAAILALSAERAADRSGA